MSCGGARGTATQAHGRRAFGACRWGMQLARLWLAAASLSPCTCSARRLVRLVVLVETALRSRYHDTMAHGVLARPRGQCTVNLLLPHAARATNKEPHIDKGTFHAPGHVSIRSGGSRGLPMISWTPFQLHGFRGTAAQPLATFLDQSLPPSPSRCLWLAWLANGNVSSHLGHVHTTNHRMRLNRDSRRRMWQFLQTLHHRPGHLSLRLCDYHPRQFCVPCRHLVVHYASAASPSTSPWPESLFRFSSGT